MTYYADLSKYAYLGREKSTFNIGWLSARHPYSRGEAPFGFIDRLEAFCCAKVNSTRGFHTCDLCSDTANPPTVSYGEESVRLGTAEIRAFGSTKRWLFGNKKRVFAAPDLIYHYVDEHEYLPPKDFIAAVLDGPLPGSPEYEAMAATYGWHEGYRRTLDRLKRSCLKDEAETLPAVRLAFPEANSDDMTSIIFCLGAGSFDWQYGEMVRILTKIDEETIDTLAKAAPSLIARGETSTGKMVYRLTAQADERFLKIAGAKVEPSWESR